MLRGFLDFQHRFSVDLFENKMATSELAALLERRQRIIQIAEEEAEQGRNDGDSDLTPSPTTTPPVPLFPSMRIRNPYTEFHEFTRKEIQRCQKTFNTYDTNKDKFIDFDELKHMMEKMGSAQTHLALKEMIREVDEDKDNKISFREFLLIFRKARAGELPEGSGLYEVYRLMEEIDVGKEGVKGAKNFFEVKIEQLTKVSQFEQEIRDEQEEKRRIAEEKKTRKAAFKAAAQFFEHRK